MAADLLQISLIAGIPVMVVPGRRDGAVLIVLTATTAVVSRASRAPTMAQLVFLGLLTVASYVVAFGDVASAATTAPTHIWSFQPRPLRRSSALRFAAASSPGLALADAAPTSRSYCHDRRADHRSRSRVGARRVRV
jgi:hypothetical protein